EERTGDLEDRQAADQAQGESNPGPHRQCRMAADEDQPQPVIVDRAGRFRWAGVVHQQSLLVLVLALVLAAHSVDRLAVGGGVEPCAGAGRDTVGGPACDGCFECFGRRVLGDLEITEASGKARDHTGPLVTVCPRDLGLDVAHANGRTSILRSQICDASVASASATSRSGASHTQTPARYSFDSKNGPSLIIGVPPRLSMTVAASGSARPPANTQ